jgi:hypothetical protein
MDTKVALPCSEKLRHWTTFSPYPHFKIHFNITLASTLLSSSDTGGECGRHERHEKCIQNLDGKSVGNKDHLGDMAQMTGEIVWGFVNWINLAQHTNQ